MRIFSIFFHPDRKITFLGGAEKRFLRFLKFLCNGEFKVKVLVLEPEPRLLNRESDSFRVFSLSKPFKVDSSSLLLDYLSWILWSFKAAVFSIPIFVREKPDLILSPNNTLPNILPAFLIKLLFRKPLYIVVHHFDITSHEKGNFSLVKFVKNYRKIGYSLSASFFKALAFILAISLLKKADKFISVSEFTARWLQELGAKRRDILVSGNGVDLKKISSFCQNLHSKVFDGVFVGRISSEKGIYSLVDAWRIVVSRWQGAHLAIVGEGPELETLKKKIQDLKLERNVMVFGGLPDEKMYKVLSRSKIFIFPSLFEGWGLAVAEALACGLPVVCYEIPALKEVFGECKSVFFISQFNSKVLAEKVLRILESFDAEKFRETSRRFVRKFDWEKIFLKELNFLQRSLKEIG